ncbi:translin-associated factor TraX [Aspergillus sp. HF37]|nr:translin-associated factor TraX [Aspergillus sp. HF37]
MAPAGTKRSRDGNLVVPASNQPVAAMDATEQPSEITSIFKAFRDELDEHYDRRERIIKTSRDITALSKKIIFTLQRLRKISNPLPEHITKDTDAKFAQIRTLFDAVVSEMDPLNTHRYQRNISPAIEEFIEAVSFAHYLQHQELISIEAIRAKLPAEILVTDEDYAMGLFDLTGEIMRFAVTSLSTGNMAVEGDEDGMASGGKGGPKLTPSQAGLVSDIQQIRSNFEAISVPKRNDVFRDYPKKVEVMQNSVEKVERAAYGILVRGSERPAGWTPDVSTVQVESF